MIETHPTMLGMLIGRFQGYHNQHHRLLKKAAIENDRLVVLIGSTNCRSSLDNPFSYEERVEMIQANIDADPELDKCHIEFRPLNDYGDNEVWAQQVRFIVADQGEYTTRTLYGCNKDASSFYLEMFPDYKLSLVELESKFSATDLREAWIGLGQCVGYFMTQSGEIPKATINWLEEREFDSNLQAEWEYYDKENKKFKDYPYPETLNFSCGDAVVYCHGKILMIKRKHNPGKGCWALPGGFKNRNETFFQAAIRELDEETGIALTSVAVMSCLIGQKLFDEPKRSYGIPRSTLAVYFDISKLFPDGSFPATLAADDAAEVNWIDVSEIEVMREIFDDHRFIISATL